jgi:23S rRNA (cytosine1962-C5)-methyltransferase
MPETAPYGEYALLDSGDGAKLERFGPHVLQRPCPPALWPASAGTALWKTAAAVYHRSASGGGTWEKRQTLPERWPLSCGGHRLWIKPTGFGHVGLFPEQVPMWSWIGAQCERGGPDVSVLNLFAYTGGSTLAAAAGGAVVTHCDASRGVVQWASENAALSGLAEANIRWIVEEATRFVRRERRRGRRYRGIVLDPPSFGRGPKGQVFKLERDLPPLLRDCAALLAEDALFVLLSAHTAGAGPLTLSNLLDYALGRRAGAVGCGEMVVRPEAGTPLLPSGTWAAWSAIGTLPSCTPDDGP